MVVFTLTVDELLTIAEELRPYTADAVKIEVAPWIRDYVVDMEKLYTELALEKIHNTPTEQESQVLNHYSELFENCNSAEKWLNYNSQVSEPPTKRCRTENATDLSQDKCDKILMKCDPGMGKTTQCKKISWDWAKKSFKQVDIVFFVSLKLVKPGDVMENIIIKQNSYVKGLKITEQKLGSILDTLGRRCLLILDGLDEHAFGSNEDVFSIIKGEKHLKCNIIVTSRPHSTREIEQYFPTVVRVEGFTRNKAEQFASKILNDKKVIEAVLNYNPGNAKEKKVRAKKGHLKEKFRDTGPIHKCPILLSFLCLLAREDNADLLKTKMHTGEIYTRMVRCLYKKYALRQGMPLDAAQFAAAMTSIGKLALKTLLSGDPMLRRDDVIKEIGIHAFDYGLLIGHEDAHKLFHDETADIFVTFPHRSIQEFLGALYFIWMLDKGEEIESVLGDKPVFLTNTLFLQFCLWLLCDNQKYFVLKNRQMIYLRMVHYCVDLLNEVTLDMKEIELTYPALDISSSSAYAKDKLCVSFLHDILVKCKNVSRLILRSNHPLNQTLGLIKPNLKLITFIEHSGEYYSISFVKSTEIVIRASYVTKWKNLRVILKHYNKMINDPVVHLHLRAGVFRFPTMEKPLQNVKTLDISCELIQLIAFNTELTQLHLDLKQYNDSEERVTDTISKLSIGNFQNLSHLSFVHCTNFQEKLSALFVSVWKNLKYLSLIGTHLLEADLGFLCLACNGPEKKLPSLTSLCVTVPSDMSTQSVHVKLFALPWLNLKQLYVNYKSDFNLNDAINNHKLPNLTCLRIRIADTTQKARQALCLDQLPNLQSVYLDDCIPGDEVVLNNLFLSELGISSTDGLVGSLSSLIDHTFPNLNTLILSNCALNSQDLTSLTQAKVKGGLPALRSLDISHNQLHLSELKCLFEESCTWNELLSLDIRHALAQGLFLHDKDDQVIDFMNDIVSRGYLPSLQRLGINRFDNRNVHWNPLEKLFLVGCELSNITDAVFWGYLPTLNTLCVEYFEWRNAEDVRLLSQLGVSCHTTNIPSGNKFSRAKCYCEK